jgi:hypothetical protein
MAPALILDTSVLIAGLRSSLGASFVLLEALGGGAMSSFVVELPAELQAEVARRAGQKPGGESAWVTDAVREKLEACAELEYLEARAARGDRNAYGRVLCKVPAASPIPGDECSPSRLING